MINIIYYAWINPQRNWRVIIEGQLQDIVDSNIMKTLNSTLYIVICCDITYQDCITELVLSFFQDNETNYFIDFTQENNFEYPAIKKMYDLAIQEPDKFYLYFHSKGMFHWYHNTKEERCDYEVTLTRGNLNLHKKVIEIFQANSDITKIGMFPAINDNQDNFVWFNSYWARGTFLITCEEPIISTNRYYYELWSGTGTKSLVYNLYENNYKKYSLNEAAKIITDLKGKYEGLKRKTLVGKEGYLFLQNDSARELEVHNYNLCLVSKLFYENDINKNYFLVVFPNKSFLFKEYLPVGYNLKYRPAFNKYATFLKDHVLDGYEVLFNETETYYKTDTHINLKGAYLVYCAFIDKINKLFSLNVPKLKINLVKEYVESLTILNKGLGDLTWTENAGDSLCASNVCDVFYSSNDIDEIYCKYIIHLKSDDYKIRFFSYEFLSYFLSLTSFVNISRVYFFIKDTL
jgi:hypothetical protein